MGSRGEDLHNAPTMTLQHDAATARARALSYFTVGYNLLEGLVSLIVAFLSGSPALLGFGFDSVIESLSGSVMIWRFWARHDLSHERVERMESRAILLVGWSFLILGAYVIFVAAKKLYLAERPDETLFGILIAVASIVLMPVLYWMKVRTARELNSRSLIADSRQTLACALLSVALLIGLLANYVGGYWWMDPAAALLIAAFLLKEGYEAIKYKDLCA